MEITVINGVSCLRRDVDNIEVYQTLLNNRIAGVPLVMQVDEYTVYYQFISGINLREYLNNKQKLSNAQISNLIRSLANVLNDLKSLNIVHKDLKPENIIISTEENIYVTDFDVSRVSKEKSADTTLFGTRGYASPEHFGYSSTTYKSDMYSLGKIIEELDTTNRYQSIVDRCIEVDPANRYDDYQELLEELERIDNLNTLKEPKGLTIFRENYSNIVIIVYVILFIMFSVNGTSNVKTATDHVLNLAASFLLVDIIDYVRVLVTRKKIVLKKLLVTFIVMAILITISALLEK